MSIELPPNLATAAPASNDPDKVAKTQTTSGDILVEAHQLRQTNFTRPQQGIQDIEELRLYQNAKRREYEQHLNKNRLNYRQWMRYAKWEVDDNHDFRRARSVMERALEVNVQHVPFWVRYVELELSHKNVNHARNVLDRGVTILPYCDKLWFLYAETEERLGNYQGVRQVFQRWLLWRPGKAAWEAYVGFERRYDEHDKVRVIFTEMLGHFNEGSVWLEWANFEKLILGDEEEQVRRVRGVYESGADYLVARGGMEEAEVQFFRLWCLWEGSIGEAERGRAILDQLVGLPGLAKQARAEVFRSLTEFERLYGTLSAVEGQILVKKELKCEAAVSANPRDYDTWWELIKIKETAVGTAAEELRQVYRQATSTYPQDSEKLTKWRRYVFLWIRFALWEEFKQRQVENAREVWRQVLAVVPHERFTFAKLWVMVCEFEMRNASLQAARKVLGRAIGLTSGKPKAKVFRFYIELETKLGQLDRARRLYEKWVEVSLESSESVSVLEEYVRFEEDLGEIDRCVALYDAAMNASTDPETPVVAFHPLTTLLASFVEFLRDHFHYDHARSVFRQVLSAADSPHTWIEFALFELTILNSEQLAVVEQGVDEMHFSVGNPQKENTRRVFNEAYRHYRDGNDGEKAMVVLDAWKNYEGDHGDSAQLQAVEKKVPTKVVRRRTVDGEEHMYHEYVFPKEAPNLSKFLASAKKWQAGEHQ